MTNVTDLVRFSPPLDKHGNPYPDYVLTTIKLLKQEGYLSFDSTQTVISQFLSHLENTGVVEFRRGRRKIDFKLHERMLKERERYILSWWWEPQDQADLHINITHLMDDIETDEFIEGLIDMLATENLIKRRKRLITHDPITFLGMGGMGGMGMAGGFALSTSPAIGNYVVVTICIGSMVALNFMGLNDDNRYYKLTSFGEKVNTEGSQYAKVVDTVAHGAKYLTGLNQNERSNGVPVPSKSDGFWFPFRTSRKKLKFLSS